MLQLGAWQGNGTETLLLLRLEVSVCFSSVHGKPRNRDFTIVAFGSQCMLQFGAWQGPGTETLLLLRLEVSVC